MDPGGIIKLLVQILCIPAIATALGIAVVGVLHVYRFVKFEIYKD
jgi:hypothetical protein